MSDMIETCLTALQQQGCAVLIEDKGYTFTLPDGETRAMPEWRFKLLCSQSYLDWLLGALPGQAAHLGERDLV